jgi:hypothetical protein
MMVTGYIPTPNLPDERGKALLRELDSLFSAVDWDPETKKKRRSGSHAARWAVAELETALIKAALSFDRHQDFRAWLNQNKGTTSRPMTRFSTVSR